MWFSSSRTQNEMFFVSARHVLAFHAERLHRYCKRCQECQIHAGIQHVHASELHSIIKPWPFRGWALDVIGEIKPGSWGKHRHILVGIDYFTKWVEAIPLREVNQDAVISFIQTIFYIDLEFQRLLRVTKDRFLSAKRWCILLNIYDSNC